MNEKKLGLLKKDIDRVTDYYDSVRLYQYPIDGMLVITELQKKKWKKCMLRSTER
jgi:CRISPR-associated protein Cas2